LKNWKFRNGGRQPKIKYFLKIFAIECYGLFSLAQDLFSLRSDNVIFGIMRQHLPR
jgi:hypothetical protein